MASEEHIKLSDFIKSVHQKLREDAQNMGPSSAWKNHLKNKENLKKYAENMKQLATEHWERNARNSSNNSRISWVYNATKWYYNEITNFRKKEVDINTKINCSKQEEIPPSTLNPQKLNLLDVGSCYNPFQQFECYNVTAIDIAPVCEDVLACDFLNVSLTKCDIVKDNVLRELQQDFYDVVVFSLLLEYLPDAEQRKLCCEKAYNVLKPEGILIIITPDSNHVGVNTKFMKSWRLILAEIGFTRVKYEKLPNIHCMVFRKAFFKEVAQRWAQIYKHNDLFNKMFIPQDFKSLKSTKESDKSSEKIEQWDNFTFLSDIDT